jgi:hypothetical protein
MGFEQAPQGPRQRLRRLLFETGPEAATGARSTRESAKRRIACDRHSKHLHPSPATKTWFSSGAFLGALAYRNDAADAC